MEIENMIREMSFKSAGCLFWTRDQDGEVWVLLGRHRPGRLFLDKTSYSVPSGVYGGREESTLEAALRIGYEETGIVNDKSKTMLFWGDKSDFVEFTVFASKLSKKVPVKHSRNFTAFEWFNLNGQVPDLDVLSSTQLDAFRTFVENIEDEKVS